MVWKSARTKEPTFRTEPAAGLQPIRQTTPSARIAVERAVVGRGTRLELLTNPEGASADRFRFLRTRLGELREVAKLRSLAITSPSPGDGKSTVAISLATALAEGDRQSVLLIEADLHHPSLSDSLSLPSSPGLAECLQKSGDPMPYVRRVEPLGWHFMPAGMPSGNPTDLLQSDAFAGVMRAVSSHFDWVVVDAPPALPLTDALVISRQVDATLLVARAGCTSREAIDETVKIIGKKYLLGIILNGAEGLTQLYSKYQGRYGKK